MLEIFKAQDINSQVYCRIAPSLIHGVGVVAIKDIPKGTQLNKFWNDLKPKRVEILHNEWALVDEEIKDIILASGCITDGQVGYYIIQHPNAHHTFFFNHSNEPNSEFGVAIKDIKKGEEITRKYAMVHNEVIKYFAKQGIII